MQEKIDTLRIVDKPHRIHPDYSCDNYFAIATVKGVSDLEKKAREGFKEINLPDYVYIPEAKELKVGDSVVHYALVCGVYSRK